MSRKCDVCQGKMTWQLISYFQFFEGQFIIVENVPAWVCEQCGEVFYEPDTVEKLQQLIWSRPTPQRTISVPVLDLADN